MNSITPFILSVNGGSSSIKFAVYKAEETLTPVFFGEIENVGKRNTTLNYTNTITNTQKTLYPTATDFTSAAFIIIDLLEKECDQISVKAIGYRIVHGMQHSKPELVTPELLIKLKELSAYDPEHLPGEIELIEVFRKHYPLQAHIACFDTSFHAAMPKVAKWVSIPRRFNTDGILRYGFHGLSYAYLMDELKSKAGDEVASGRIILAHLGNGASLAAIKDGKSIDTSMGFTPTSGLLMGTRSGDLDPGVACYLMQTEKLSPEQFNHLVNHESGLLGISETSSDMRELLDQEHTDIRAAEAIELFCYQAKKWIGSFAAVLGGLDTLVFSGGIGGRAPEIRERICSGLQFLGVALDSLKNKNNEEIISEDKSKVSVRVMKTNEELMIARLVCQVLNYSFKQ